MIRRIDIILSIISGILLVLSFPPFDLYMFSWIALLPLLISLYGKSPKRAFFLGLLSGLVYFSGIIFWVFNPLYFYGGIPLILSIILVIALCVYLSLYVGVFSILFNYLLSRSRFPALFLAPVLWVTLEFLRTYAFTGFPWSILGYSQYKFLIFIQIADITGVYGISFLIMAINGALFDLLILPKRQIEMPLFERWPMFVGLVVLCLSIVISLSYGIWRLSINEGNHTIRASVIQGNIEQDRKWDVRFQREIIETYKGLSEEAALKSPSLIVWPETATPFVFGHDKDLTQEVTEFQKTLGIHLIFGSVTVKGVKDNEYQLANSSILLSPDGRVLSTYDKIHLVPYGEYVPLQRLFPFVKKLVVAVGDFTPGKEYVVMQTPFAQIGNLICYEIIFPGLVRKFAERGANLFVTITNDAWFGRWGAPYQHFSMAVLRAVENRAPVVRAANTGVSGFIDAKGRIKKKSDIFVRSVMTEDLKVGGFKKSFYSRYGDLFAFFCIISSIILVANNIPPLRGLR